MSATSTSSTAADEDRLRCSALTDSGETSTSSTPYTPVPFSAGNPRIEETRGVMNLIPEDTISSPPKIPGWRKPLLCVLEVPNHMTYADFCMFCGSFIQNVLDMRVVRNDLVEDSYSVLLTFKDQNSTDDFYRHFYRKQFSYMEEKVCRVLFTADVWYTVSIEHSQTSVTKSMEPATCAVCLDRLDQDTGGILTTICNHSFHCSCISKWADSSCPVCRYCQQKPEKTTCSECQISENLWMCVICGFVGCGRYKEGHAIKHWKDTQHCYSLELETKRVWDYVGDNYVHRLIQSKTDGKLVELNSHCTQGDDNCGSCQCNTDAGVIETLLNSKIEQIIDEHNTLLTSQLESKREYYDSILREINGETEKEIAETIWKAETPKLRKMQTKLNKCIQEKNFITDIHDSLNKNDNMWMKKIQDAEGREEPNAISANRILELEEELMHLMLTIEDGSRAEPSSTANSNEIEESFVSVAPAESSLREVKGNLNE